jgi:hypothetical protein
MAACAVKASAHNALEMSFVKPGHGKDTGEASIVKPSPHREDWTILPNQCISEHSIHDVTIIVFSLNRKCSVRPEQSSGVEELGWREC